MTIEETLMFFDQADKKGYDYHEILAALSSMDEKEKAKIECVYEALAFRLVPSSGENPWGFYFGPQFTFEDKDGNLIYDPNITEITPAAIAYWEKRYKECNNPLLVSRYAGLVWEFKQKIAHQAYSSDLYRIYVDSLLKLCNEDYCSHPVITANNLERLFVIAKGQDQDLQLVKKAYDDFEVRHSGDDTVRYWASQFLLMLDNHKKFTSEEIESLVKKHEERLTRLSNPVEGKELNP